VALLSTARAIAGNNILFKSNVRLVAFVSWLRVARLNFCLSSQPAFARQAKSKVYGDLVLTPVSPRHPTCWTPSISD